MLKITQNSNYLFWNFFYEQFVVRKVDHFRLGIQKAGMINWHFTHFTDFIMRKVNLLVIVEVRDFWSFCDFIITDVEVTNVKEVIPAFFGQSFETIMAEI